MSQRVNVCSELKTEISRRRRETESEEGAEVAGIRHETRRANHGQDESAVTCTGGPHPPMLQNRGRNCG